MALTDDLSRRIRAKRQEIAAIDQQAAALEQQRTAAQAYVQGLEEALKLAERTTPPQSAAESARALRKGSMPARAYPVLKSAGRPVYLVNLLESMGVATTLANKRALASALSAYARKREIFTRPEPNTFGLIEFEQGTEGADGEPEAVPAQAQLKLAR